MWSGETVAYLMEFNWMCLHRLSFHLQPFLKEKLFVWTAGKGDIVLPTSMSWTKQFDIVKADIVLPTSMSWTKQFDIVKGDIVLPTSMN
jgi:hypothetical protein